MKLGKDLTFYSKILFQLGLVVFLVSLLIYLIFALLDLPIHIEQKRFLHKSQVELRLSLKKLSLKNSNYRITLPDLKDKISITILKNRPDSMDKREKIAIHLLDSQETKESFIEEKIFLKLSDKKLHFSKEITPLTLALNKKDSILGNLQLDNCTNFEIENLAPISLKISNQNDLEKLSRSPLNNLSKAIYLGKDFLLEQAKGQISFRLLINSKNITLGKNEFLIFKENEFKKVIDLVDIKSFDVIKINEIKDKSIFLDSWDYEGNYFSFEIPLKCDQNPLQVKADEVFSNIRFHSKNTVSCFVNKKHFILNVGEWVIKKDKRYAVLKSQEEKDLFLNSCSGKELFIIDAIYPHCLSIVQFNSDRTTATQYSLGIYSPQRSSLPSSELQHQKRF